MDLKLARGVIDEQHHAVLATRRRDRSVQMSPVLVAVDADGHVVISSRQTAYKVKNLYRDSTATVCVLPNSFFGRWIQVDGTAVIIELPEAMDGLIDYYRRISGEHPDWDEYRTAMQAEKRVLIRIHVTRVGPDRSG